MLRILEIRPSSDLNPLNASVALILKPVNWFAVQISIDWFLYEGTTGI